GKPYSFCWRAAEEFDEAVVAAAPADGVLRAETLRRDFKRSAHVVVESAHEAPVLLIENAAEFEFALHGVVLRFAIVAKVVGDFGKRSDDGLLVFEFGIEHTQRIRFDTALRIGAEFIFYLFES